MFEEKVNRAQAIKEVTSWLDAKKIPNSKRTSYKEHVDTIIDNTITGVLSFGADNTITHTLEFPIEIAGASLSELKYVPRLSIADVKAKTANVKGSDSEGRILAYVSALTGQTASILERMDTTDNGVAGSIALFFM